MNDKFLVLLQQSVKEYKQSWDVPEDYTIVIPQHIIDRFAKLIIQEAMGIVFDEVSDISDWDSANAVIAKVEEHFGLDYERKN